MIVSRPTHERMLFMAEQVCGMSRMMKLNNWRGWPLFFLLAMPATAYCQSTFLPYVSTQYEYNNNVFALPNSSAAFSQNQDPRLGDSDLKAVAGADENYLFGRQRLYATVEGRYVEYDHFGYLSHSEYLGKLGFDWKLFDLFDGTLLGSIERVMAPFANRDTQTQLALNLDRNAIAKFNVRVAPEWRVETSVDYHDLDSPIEDFPDYGLSETTGHVALKYVGIANLTYGISADYLHGQYRNAPTPGDYDQTNLNLTMTYLASGLSQFNGAVGHTKRDQGEDQNNISALTGDLGYTRQLTGKTSVHVDVARQVNSYIGAGGSELDTVALVQLNLQPTYKIGVQLGYQYIWSDFVGQTVPGADIIGRKDRTPGATFRMNYQVRRWLSIQPYATYQRRNSTEEIFEFSGTTIGIKLLVQKPGHR